MPYDPTDWDTADDTAKQTAQHFFTDPDGAHVTENPSDPTTGANALLDSSWLHFRIGTDDVSKFGATGSQIGKDSDAHLVMDANSMELYDENGNGYFFAGDKRDLVTGVYQVTDTIILSDYVTDTFQTVYPTSGVSYVVKNGTPLPNTDWSDVQLPGYETRTVILASMPSLGDMLEFTYDVSDPFIAYGLGGDARGMGSVAEGTSTASGKYAHAEGVATNAEGIFSHAEGSDTYARAPNAHAEGYMTTATGSYSHSEGDTTTAWGGASHAEGNRTYAGGHSSHAEGIGTQTTAWGSHAGGKYNVVDSYPGTYAEIIGNGTADNARSNARTLDFNGNEELKGELYLGGCTANGETPYPAVRHNTTTHDGEYYDGGSWKSLGLPFHIYTGTFTANVGTNQTSYMAWTASTFRSTFKVSSGHEADCFVAFGNDDVSLGSKGTMTAEWWPSSYNPYGWRVRWQNQQSNNQKFSYLVIVPNAYSTV